MVPILLDPLAKKGFYHAEIDNAPYMIKLLRRAMDVYTVAMPMRVSAFSLMPVDTMARLEIMYPDCLY